MTIWVVMRIGKRVILHKDQGHYKSWVAMRQCPCMMMLLVYLTTGCYYMKL